MNSTDIFEWSASILGSVGALLLSLNIKYSGWGYVFFFIANIAWITFGYLINAQGLIMNQVFFSITSLIGIKQYLLKKRAFN